ncbi:MAG: hypothetical protein EOM59_13475 [Clostridia bacterium]|nr:hypothetical protein [Clostridia bacterium]
MNTKDTAVLETKVGGASQTLQDIEAIRDKVRDLKQSTLELNAAKAQQDAQIQKNKATLNAYEKQLADANRTVAKASEKNIELGQKLSDLENKNQKGSDQWNRLSAAINENNAKIAEAESVIKDVTVKHNELLAVQKEEIGTRNGLNKQIRENNLKVKEQVAEMNRLNGTLDITEMSYNQLSAKAMQLRRELNNTSKAADPEAWEQLNRELGQVESQMDKVRAGSKVAGHELNGFKGIMDKVSMAIKAFILIRILDWLREVAVAAFNTRKEFAKYEAVLRNSLQSTDRAARAMGMLRDLAKDTPFQLEELTQAYIKMINRGLNPTRAEIIKLGDVAAAQGKSLDQLIEAMLDASTGEFERLKEFGIKARKEGENVKFTFKGITTEVRYTEDAISDYILSLGTLAGVQGGMAVQMEELEGKTSNLSDTWKEFLNMVGTFVEPAAKKVLGFLTGLLSGVRAGIVGIRQLKAEARTSDASDAYDNTGTQFDTMVASLVKQGMEKKEAIERSIRAMRKASEADLQDAEAQLRSFENRYGSNAPTKELEAAQERLKTNIAIYRAELDALKDKERDSAEGGVVRDPKKELKEFKSAMDLRLQEMDNAHQLELAKLKKNKLELSQTEEEYNIAVLQSEKKYQDERIKVLDKYKKETTDPKTLAKIAKLNADAQNDALTAAQKQGGELLSIAKVNRDKLMDLEESSYKTQLTVFQKQLAEKQITQEQFNALVLSLDASTTDQRLKIAQGYLTDVTGVENATGTEKAKAVADANSLVLDADLKAAQARAAQQKALQNLLKDFKGEFKLTTVGEETALQLKALEASYQARKEMAVKANMDTSELDAAYEKAKTNIVQTEEEKRNQIRQQYGLLSLQDQFNIETDLLKQQYDAGLLNEEEFQKAKNKIKTDYLKKSFDYYSGLASGAFAAIQDAEMANIDAKYDVEIERAQGNADEVARLENEKEKKKLEVQKKYADVNFAIKASEIIANTAVAIMKALAELGPIAGPIAAALMGVTGAAQLITANAERNKIKNMTVGGSGASSSGSGSGSRVVGLASGGYMPVTRAQDGANYMAAYDPGRRGFVSQPTVLVGEAGPEFVVSNAGVNNPTIRPLIDFIDASQRAGNIRTVDLNQIMRSRMAGFASGGYTNQQPSAAPEITEAAPLQYNDNTSLRPILSELIFLLRDLRKKGIDARVVYSQFEKTKEVIERSKEIGGK